MGIVINDDLELYKKYIKNHVNNKRYIHSLGVCYTAASLAMRYNCSLYKAQIAGILHDCAKGIDYKDLYKLCKKANILITDVEKDSPELLHSKYGAYIAEYELNIKDSEILNAIYYHTTGRPNMSLLEKIIFISDYIEPGRGNLPNIDDIRQTSFINIDEAVYKICEGSIEYLNKKKASIDSVTIDTYNHYKSLMQ